MYSVILLVLVCISLLINVCEHHFMWLLAIHISSFVIGLFVLLLLIYRGLLSILNTSPLWEIFITGRGRQSWALSITVCFFWLCQELKAWMLFTRPFLKVTFAVGSLRSEVIFVCGEWAGLLLLAIKMVNPQSLVFFPVKQFMACEGIHHLWICIIPVGMGGLGMNIYIVKFLTLP